MNKIKIDLTNIKVSLVNISSMEKEDEPLYSSDEEEEQSENENTEEEEEKSEVDDKSEIDEEEEQDDEQEDEEDADEKDDESDNEIIDDEAKLYSGGKPKKTALVGGSLENSDDEEDDDDYQTPYLQKFNVEINKNYILDFHPECAVNNYDEISVLTQIIRDGANNVIDDLHKTIPFLTKYERTRVIGQRAKQINSGAKAFVKVPENVIDGYLVAELELIQKRIPFIIRRPTPGGGCEYWNLKDLEVVSF